MSATRACMSFPTVYVDMIVIDVVVVYPVYTMPQYDILDRDS